MAGPNRPAFLWLLPLVAAGCFTEDVPDPVAEPGFRLTQVLAGLSQPVFVTHAGDGTGRLFVVEQAGRVLAWSGGPAAPEPFLDIRTLVGSGGEKGLFAIAFSPGFPEDPRAYVHYTDRAGDTVLARYRAETDGSALDPASAEILLSVDQPFSNHNGGALLFAPDGTLYLGLGDGGGAGDPHGSAQSLDTLLGKVLRLEVRGDGGYRIPSDNPFVGRTGRDEIWAYGLRNPWRMSFDSATGDLWIGDVGQDRVEEIDFQAAASDGGENYGWNFYEGTRRFNLAETPPRGLVAPVAEYPLAEGNCAVTGGFVYRGSAVPALEGTYLYADYCSGRIWGLTKEGARWEEVVLLDTDLSITSFGEDEEGELYVVDHGGTVHRLTAT